MVNENTNRKIEGDYVPMTGKPENMTTWCMKPIPNMILTKRKTRVDYKVGKGNRANNKPWTIFRKDVKGRVQRDPSKCYGLWCLYKNRVSQFFTVPRVCIGDKLADDSTCSLELSKGKL